MSEDAQALMDERSKRYPIGASITVHDLDQDPYPIYAQLRSEEPISWIASLRMWVITRYDDVRDILLDSKRFTTASERSLIVDTFGVNVLSSEGAEHSRLRNLLQPPFAPNFVKNVVETNIIRETAALIANFRPTGRGDLRVDFAARLPILVMLNVLGVPRSYEMQMRKWYDSFEAALSNFSFDEAIRRQARGSVSEFNDCIDEAIKHLQGGKSASLLGMLAEAPRDCRLSQEEIKRNFLIVFFGGISTVEALVLNCLWALFTFPDVRARVQLNPGLFRPTIEECMRWMGPVQSATRHTASVVQYKDAVFLNGEVVNCMLGAANRDPEVFPTPDQFDIDRSNLQRQIGFATGVHACLGLHLARVEARVALSALLHELPGLMPDPEKAVPPRGHEFRQPRSMHVLWKP